MVFHLQCFHTLFHLTVAHAHNQMRSRAQGCQVRGFSRVATDLFLFRGLKQSLPHPAGMTEDSRQRENHEKKKKKTRIGLVLNNNWAGYVSQTWQPCMSLSSVPEVSRWFKMSSIIEVSSVVNKKKSKLIYRIPHQNNDVTQ